MKVIFHTTVVPISFDWLLTVTGVCLCVMPLLQPRSYPDPVPACTLTPPTTTIDLYPCLNTFRFIYTQRFVCLEVCAVGCRAFAFAVGILSSLCSHTPLVVVHPSLPPCTASHGLFLCTGPVVICDPPHLESPAPPCLAWEWSVSPAWHCHSRFLPPWPPERGGCEECFCH